MTLFSMLLAAFLLVSAEESAPTAPAEDASVLRSLPWGHGCCSGATPPTLRVEALGSPEFSSSLALRFGGEGAPAQAQGWVLLSALPARAQELGNGGYLYVDPTSMLRLSGVVVDHRGHWAHEASLPSALADLDRRLVAQAMFPDPGMSTGFALSDALELRFEAASLR